MVVAYHSTFTTYGFWLSNDSRGSWSDFVRSFDLYLTGTATKTDETRSLARRPLDREQRDRARAALKYPVVRFNRQQIECVAQGFSRAVDESGYILLACAILQDHVHAVVKRYSGRTIEKIIGHLKTRATQQLTAEGLNPMARFELDGGGHPSPWVQRCVPAFPAYNDPQMPDLSVNLAGLRLSNPTLTCSGTCGYAFEYADYMDLGQLGAFVTKSITREERAGNEPARIVEVRAGMLNAIGLANVGLDRFLAEKVPLLRKMPCPVVVNVAGHSFDDYTETCAAMNGLDCVHGVELNVSCPNVKDGLTFGTHPGRLKELVAMVKKALPNKPLMVKLSPNVEDITVTARAAVEGGADVLTLVNTFTAMAVDIYNRRPRLANVTGGLSGPAIKPIALHMVSRVYRNVAKPAGVPIVGMGGVQSWQDAVEFILAGASAVAIGTALFVDPATPNKICTGLAEYMQKTGVERLSELVGALELPGDEPRTTPYP